MDVWKKQHLQLVQDVRESVALLLTLPDRKEVKRVLRNLYFGTLFEHYSKHRNTDNDLSAICKKLEDEET